MDKRRFHFGRITNLAPWRGPLTVALQQINERSGGRYTTEEQLDWIAERLTDDATLLVVALDLTRYHQPADRDAAFCFMSYVEQLSDPVLGRQIAFVRLGWIRGGLRGAPFDAWLPDLEAWARERGCRAIMTMTERATRSARERRLDPANARARERGVLAYERSINRRGFRRRETLFEKELVPL